MHVMGGVLDANLHALFCTDTHTLRFNCVSAAEKSPTHNLSLFLSLFFCLSLSLSLSFSLSLSLSLWIGALRGARGTPGSTRHRPRAPRGCPERENVNVTWHENGEVPSAKHWFL